MEALALNIVPLPLMSRPAINEYKEYLAEPFYTVQLSHFIYIKPYLHDTNYPDSPQVETNPSYLKSRLHLCIPNL